MLPNFSGHKWMLLKYINQTLIDAVPPNQDQIAELQAQIQILQNQVMALQ